MAIYTKLTENNLEEFFLNYNLGKLLNYKGIQEGIENTNYFTQTDKGKFILTVYEKRVEGKDLPFFMGLMKNLFDANFPSPEPIINKNGNYITEIFGKKAAVVSFLDGSSKKNLNPNDCYKVGIQTAKLHLITKNLSGKRENKLSVNSWRKIYQKVQKDCSKIQQNLTKIIEKNLDEIENNWPKNIPSGIIHADLFPDNIFFKDDKLTGIIDFYFSCYDFYVFEIAICLNALCFEGQKENLSFNVTKAKKFIDGYSSIKKITEEEKKSLKILCQGAAMRFLLTRVFDYLNLTEGALVKIKDPIEYLKRLEFHNSVKNYQDYFF
ncbi:MAG TPA: homoserine kinase [Pelagibacteraceae bacterium]|jgi:homoserine kinase type II|nr:homoserine kinase [Pelagibacteraceae bacterium]|tara:strand:- start:4113 stop:5081 length:969 start_codon:yes stop_codon:yes gene_type:complete